MSMFECRFENCGSFFMNEHALDVHESMKHNSQSSSVQLNFSSMGESSPETADCLFKRSLPRRLGGLGRRLPLDRETDQLTQEQRFYNPKEDSDFLSFCDRLGARDDLFGEKSERTDDGGAKEIVGLEEILDKIFLIASSMGKRNCNEILKVLLLYWKNVETILQTHPTVEKLRHLKTQMVTRRLEENGFRRVKLRHKEIETTLYMKDAVKLLQNQMRLTPASDILIATANSSQYDASTGIISHPMNANIGRYGCQAAEKYIKSHESREVIWRMSRVHGEQSFVGAVQVFSDKSVTSLGANGLAFYPLHITVLNYTEERRRYHVQHGNTIAAYLPVHDQTPDAGCRDAPCNEPPRKGEKLSRLMILELLHFSIEHVLQTLALNALKGIPIETADNTRQRMHLVLASYVSDNPETKDLLALKRGGTTSAPCYRCFISKAHLAKGTVAKSRTSQHSVKVLEGYFSGDPESKELLKLLSMLPSRPIGISWPMATVHPTLDVYRIFRGEPMHDLSHGISPLIKDCLVNMLRDEHRKTSAMKTRKGEARTFKSVRKPVLSACNQFLRDVERHSVGYGLRVDFAKGERSDTLNGFFNETGVVGMLEAKDYDKVDLVSPFIGAIVDRLCGIDDGQTTLSYVRYVELLQIIFRYGRRPGWTWEDLQTLRRLIKEFQTVSVRIFARYQSSELRTCKWHALNHLVDNIEDVGCIEVLHGGIYESAHKQFKALYSLTSKRRSRALQEAIQLHNEQEHNFNMNDGQLAVHNANSGMKQAVANDSQYLVRSGPLCSVLDLVNARKQLFGEYRADPLDSYTDSLARFLGEDGLYSMISLVREYLSQNGYDEEEAAHVRFRLPASVYISGHLAPTLADVTQNEAVFLPKASIRIAQRIVAKVGFYDSDKVRMDDIMVRGDDEDVAFPQEKFIAIWFAKALAFLRFDGNVGKIGTNRSTKQQFLNEEESINEYCLVQYYDVLPKKIVSLDKIDKILGCVRLMWDRESGVKGELSAARSFGLVPVSSICGRIHVLSIDRALALLDDDVQRKQELQQLFDANSDWSKRTFYVNRFYQFKTETYKAT